MIIVVAGIVAATVLVPSSVDAVPLDHEQALAIVREVARDPGRIRAGFFAIVVFMALLGPAIRPLRRLAPSRGAVCTEVGYRLISIGSIAAAVGNSFAPLTLSSSVGLDENVMADFFQGNSTSFASFAILAVYGLLPIGSIVLTVGLLRTGAVPAWQPIVLGIGLFGLMPSPLGPLTLLEAALLAAAFATMGRTALAATPE
jgi:hypothetical protein